MNFFISEKQFNFVITETKTTKITKNMEEMNSFATDVIDKTSSKYKINLKFLLTWGTAIAGIMMPLDQFIRSGEFDLSDEQIGLLLVSVVCSIFYENKKVFQELIARIKNEGIYDDFKKVKSKGEKLKSSFFDFISSLNLTLGSVLEAISYSFLIPIVPDIVEMSKSGSDVWDLTERIVNRLLASGVVLVSGEMLTDIISKMIRKFSK